MPTSDPYQNPPDSLHIMVPFLPPTSNKIYITDWRRRMRFKSAEAKAFSEKFKKVVPQYLPWISQMVTPEQDPSVTYKLEIHFFFPEKEIINTSWGDAKRSAKTRYKKMDTGNRSKLIVDCLADAVGIDDMYFFELSVAKYCCDTYSLDPQVHIYLFRRPSTAYGV